MGGSYYVGYQEILVDEQLEIDRSNTKDHHIERQTGTIFNHFQASIILNGCECDETLWIR